MNLRTSLLFTFSICVIFVMSACSKGIHSDDLADELEFGISQITDQEVYSGGEIGPTSFTLTYLRDGKDLSERIQLEIGSSNQDLLPLSRISVNGVGSQRTLTIRPVPGLIGFSTVSLIATGGKQRDTQTFTVQVVNQSPEISGLFSRRTEVGRMVEIPFRIADAETPVEDLVLEVRSHSPSIVADNETGRQFTGEGAERRLVVTPQEDVAGVARLEIMLADGQGESVSQYVEVHYYRPLTISGLSSAAQVDRNQESNLEFMIDQSPVSPDAISWHFSSSNTDVIATAQVQVRAGENANERTLSLTPQPNQVGETEIGLRYTLSPPEQGGDDETGIPTAAYVNEGPWAGVPEPLATVDVSVIVRSTITPSPIPTQFVARNVSAQVHQVAFSVGDPLAATSELSTEASVVEQSQDVIIAGDLTITGSGSARTLHIPLLGDNAHGSAQIALRVENPLGIVTTELFDLYLVSAPEISGVHFAGAELASGADAFFIADGQNHVFSVIVDAVDEHVENIGLEILLAPHGTWSKTLVSTEATRSTWQVELHLPEGELGAYELSLRAVREGPLRSEPFVLNLNLQLPPTISQFGDLTGDDALARQTTISFPFEVRHPEDAILAAGLSVTAVSQDASIIGPSQISVTPVNGSTVLRQLQISTTDVVGLTNITLTVTDERGLQAQTQFSLEVGAELPSLGEAVDAPHLTWVTGGDASWRVTDDKAVKGRYAARSGALDPNQSSWIKTTVNGPGRLSFQWAVGAAATDSLALQIAPVPDSGDPVWTTIAQLSGGQGDWTQFTYALTSTGAHYVRWIYQRDSGAAEGLDRAWLDAVQYDEGLAIVPISPKILPTGTTLEIDGIVTYFGEEAMSVMVSSEDTALISVIQQPDPVSADADPAVYDYPFTFRIQSQPVSASIETVITIRATVSEGGEVVEAVHRFSVTITPESAELAKALDYGWEGYDNTGWITGGDAAWFEQSDESYFNGDAAQSGAISHNQESWMQVTIPEDGWLSFYWKTDSERSIGSGLGDILRLTRNGDHLSSVSGDRPWRRYHAQFQKDDIVRWTYRKDGSIHQGRDAAWVDWVVFVEEETLLIDDVIDGVLIEDGTVGQATMITVHAHGYADWPNLQYRWGLDQGSLSNQGTAVHLGDGMYALAIIPVQMGAHYVEFFTEGPDPVASTGMVELRVNP
ncbi:MAG: hypothetical protein EA401_02165 [Planctomycetota bacterium]|nr:MAG: hypothetical protein EA401_02165 [Planctomycetota bacterium]